ncbi:MAG TPA: 2-oxoglutarate dehydrogenase complex dihydrolipoyllysine-residue succinyltransferase [Desulfotignum sp.]|nr:2-oxoglutarate dehydrogenase complex dihydrolipoyllysine-residue succinyltransferase [Desulfotignum sp.]
MSLEVKIPSVGESVTEALLVQWLKNDGDTVETDDPLFVIETDKITLEVTAEAGGELKIRVKEGETVAIGTVVAVIETPEKDQTDAAETTREPDSKENAGTSSRPAQKEAAPGGTRETEPEKSRRQEKKETGQTAEKSGDQATSEPFVSPSVRRLAEEKQVDLSGITPSGPGGRITKGDVLLFLEASEDRADDTDISAPARPARQEAEPDKAESDKTEQDKTEPDKAGTDEPVTRDPMTPIRRRIAQHLLAARQNTAMLTTFNEIDMSRVMALRRAYKEPFKEKHQVSLGYMSFFIKACIEALKQNPQVNAFVDGNDIVHHHYYHVGVAIGSGKGLVVPVIRHADRLDFAGIEKAIVEFVDKIATNRLELADLEGGTFTISNGGIYGSLLSTPILNSPQSGILGMHKIEKRPVVVDDEVVIRPMMYVALSYDHRIVDGREAVTCLKKIKACVENPERMLLEV